MRHFLEIDDVSPDELRRVLDLSEGDAPQRIGRRCSFGRRASR